MQKQVKTLKQYVDGQGMSYRKVNSNIVSWH